MRDRIRAFRAVLESLGLASQFQRGRRLFRAGAVQSLTISTSVVVATVRDADPEIADTHRVRIAVRAFTAAQWRQVEQALSEQALRVATLLAGEVPDDVDEVLAESGLSLLPQSVDEVALSCSCRSWEEPCRHVIATWYALAQEFERDPFAMFAWRGRGRDELLAGLRRSPSAPAVTSAAPRGFGPGGFWRAGPRARRPGRLPGTRRPDAILDQLDPLPLTVGRHAVLDLIRPVYARVVDPDR